MGIIYHQFEYEALIIWIARFFLICGNVGFITLTMYTYGNHRKSGQNDITENQTNDLSKTKLKVMGVQLRLS